MHRLKLTKTRNSSKGGSKSARSERVTNYKAPYRPRTRNNDENGRPFSCMPENYPSEAPTKQQRLAFITNLRNDSSHKRKTRTHKKSRTRKSTHTKRKRTGTPPSKSRRRITTGSNKDQKRKTPELENSFCNIYEDFKNATRHPISLFSSPEGTDELESENEAMASEQKNAGYSNRPHTSSGINLADYKFGTFKTFEAKSRAASAPLSRVGRHMSPNQEKDKRPPTRQRPPPEALHLELPLHYRLNSSHQSFQTNRPLTAKEFNLSINLQ